MTRLSLSDAIAVLAKGDSFSDVAMGARSRFYRIEGGRAYCSVCEQPHDEIADFLPSYAICRACFSKATTGAKIMSNECQTIDEAARWKLIQALSDFVARQDGAPTATEQALCGAVLRAIESLRETSRQLSDNWVNTERLLKEALDRNRKLTDLWENAERLVTGADRLREVLREALDALETIVALDDGDKPDLWHFEKEFEAARAAIKKARGTR